jgi:hypothetical protein
MIYISRKQPRDEGGISNLILPVNLYGGVTALLSCALNMEDIISETFGNLVIKTFLIYFSVQFTGPPLWSSGQSSWLQIRRPGFDSRHYQIFLKKEKEKENK